MKIKENYFRDGYISPIDILSSEAALFHRKELEKAEKKSKIWGIKVKDGIALRGNNISISNKNMM